MNTKTKIIKCKYCNTNYQFNPLFKSIYCNSLNKPCKIKADVLHIYFDCLICNLKIKISEN